MVDGSSTRWRAVIRMFNETVRFMVNLTSSNRWRRNTSKCVSESPCLTTRVSFSSVVSFSKTSTVLRQGFGYLFAQVSSSSLTG